MNPLARENYILVEGCCQQGQCPCLEDDPNCCPSLCGGATILGTVQLHCHDATCKINLSCVNLLCISLCQTISIFK